MKQYINIPSKVLSCFVSEITPSDYWPYDNGRDPYWKNGTDPKPFRWVVSMTVETQFHSSKETRIPGQFTGHDINVGDYIADTSNGAALKIIAVLAKTDISVQCVVEDVFRYNTFRDYSGNAKGIFDANVGAVVFELNESGQPVVDVSTTSLGSNFFNNLASRFQNVEQVFNFVLEKENHGFVVGDLIAADPTNNTFVLATPAYPFLIGTVSNTDIGPHAFAVTPFEKVIDNYNALIGDVASIIYADDETPGKYALAGNHPIMIGLRQETKTISEGSVADPTTMAGSQFSINGAEVYVSTGLVADFINDVAAVYPMTGVIAEAYSRPTVAEQVSSPIGLSMLPLSATINGVLVNFTTTTAGEAFAGAPGYAALADFVVDINAANIPNIVADIQITDMGQVLILKETASGPITIVNGPADGMGNVFAGTGSISGLAENTGGSSTVYVRLVADDARPINIADVSGTALTDYGLVSAENGTKAAAIMIDRGIRQAATYVVSSIPARDAITAYFGDQCFVQDKGNGEWAHYIRTLENVWVKIADKDSSDTDAQTVEVEITHETDVNDVIYTVSGGSRVTFVTVTVTEQFNGLNPIISVGDADDTARLMTNDQNDLTSLGAYSTTPSYIYSGSQDVDITFTFNAANSTSGKAVIAISYT